MKRLDLGLDEFLENNEEVVEEATEEKSFDYNTDDFVLATVTPFSMNKNKAVDITFMNFYFLAQSITNKTYILRTSYLIENELEDALMEDIPFNVDNNFSSFRICADIVNNNFPQFITDFKFNINEISNNEGETQYRFSITARELNNGVPGTVVTFELNSDIFCSLKYIDNYIFEGEVNNYELSKASISARIVDNLSEIIMIDNIDRIVAIAPMKNTTTYAIEFVVTSKDEKYTILSTFNFGTKFPRKKFKGMTIDKINNTFLSDSDQYLQIFSEFCHFENTDKEYLIIKGKNKDNINKIFFMDSTNRLELETIIGEY